ncbi:unnamed protein product, partial [Musa acuminata var. zebrina]
GAPREVSLGSTTAGPRPVGPRLPVSPLGRLAARRDELEPKATTPRERESFWPVVGGGTNATPPVTVPIVASSRDRPLGDRSLDPLRASKRRVPNGPDPIHNRLASVTAPCLITLLLMCFSGEQGGSDDRQFARSAATTKKKNGSFGSEDGLENVGLVLHVTMKWAIF